MSYWFHIKLDKDVKSGTYQGCTHPFIFDKNSFTPKQLDINKTNEMMVYPSAIVIGMILMSALYTAIIFVYRRQKEFIYYTLMQVSMSLYSLLLI